MASPVAYLLYRLPESWLRRFSGQPAVKRLGRTLDAAAQFTLSQIPAAAEDLDSLDPNALRQEYASGPNLGIRPPQPCVRQEHEVQVADGTTIAVREYRPAQWQPEGFSGLYMHGGGWVIGDLQTHDSFCAYMAAKLNVRFFAVDYRRAPEHPFPIPLQDSHAVWNWVLERSPAERTMVAGDSAGGNLATALCLQRIMDGTSLPVMQLLIYPAVDARMETASIRHFGEGFLLTQQMMQWFWNCYLSRPDDRTNPLAAPALADPELLAKMPPTQIVVAGFDPLFDEGAAYGAALKKLGVRVLVHEYASLIHEFANMMAMPAAARAIRHCLSETRQMLASF
ncbi:MAG: alpha/beta hydrolase [Gammaproteobacteria bacterium]